MPDLGLERHLQAILSIIPVSDPQARENWLAHCMKYLNELSVSDPALESVLAGMTDHSSPQFIELIQEAYLTWPEAWPGLGFRVTA